MPKSRKGRKKQAAKAATTKIEEDWQFNKSVAECNRHMLEHGIATDVTFLVSDENADSEVKTFSAHKYMLISRSPVFYTMLCGVLAETGQIRVTDVHPEAFRQMLNYIYTDDLELNLDLVAHVINTSTKYLLPGLKTKCAEFIKDNLNTDNVCTILDQILIFEQNDLNEFCLNFIMRETQEVIESEAFLAISREALSKILGINSCEVKEVDVFQACLKLARQKCVEEKKEATATNVREVLGDCITQFRFSDIADFARDVCPTGVFTKEEENEILRHLADRQTIPAPDEFHCEPRLRPFHTVLTTEDVQHIECEKLDFNMKVTSKNNTDIKVLSLFIGNGPSFQPNDRVNITYGNAVIDVNVSYLQDNKMLQLKCNSQLIIKPGSSNMQITYKVKSSMYYETTATNAVVYGVTRRQMTLKDKDRIELQVCGNQTRIIPLLGLTCQIVS